MGHFGHYATSTTKVQMYSRSFMQSWVSNLGLLCKPSYFCLHSTNLLFDTLWYLNIHWHKNSDVFSAKIDVDIIATTENDYMCSLQVSETAWKKIKRVGSFVHVLFMVGLFLFINFSEIEEKTVFLVRTVKTKTVTYRCE